MLVEFVGAMYAKKRISVDIDARLGANIRKRRIMLGLSQGETGEAVGITFQQIQKYENSRTPVTVSKLIGLAKVMQCDIHYLLDGVEGSEVSAVEASRLSIAALRMARAYDALSPKRRRLVYSMVEAMAIDPMMELSDDQN